MRQLSLIFYVLLFSVFQCAAQNFEYAMVTQQELNLKNYPLDSNANAIVTKEFGTASIRLNDETGRMYIDFEYHVRIKILNKNGFGSGNVLIPLRSYSDETDDIKDLRATTINIVNGRPVLVELDKKKIFNERKNKYWTLTKFTMPNLTEGSIIEYSYRIQSPYIFNFKTWTFQSDIPKLRSEYIANIPSLYNYNVVLRGSQKLKSQNAELKRECLRVRGQAIDCSQMTYIMEDVPAFIEEDYMTAADNFKSAIYFELSDYYLMNGSHQKVTKTWNDVDFELTTDKSFGSQIKRKDVFKNLLPEMTKGGTDDLSKARAVYNYIRKNIKQNGFAGIFSETNIKTALETHSGNIADINLALIAALSAAGLDAEAVILSTRSNGTVNNLFPVISDFNYVVAKVNIAGQSYLLDASDPLLPFGLLPLHCINGQGRVINLKKPSYWYDLTASQKESTRHHLDAVLGPDGKIKGTLTTYSSGYAGLNKRSSILAASSVEDYVEKLDERMPRISILKHEIRNLDSVDNPLVEVYEIEMKAFDDLNKDLLYFNPFFINRISKNPFNLNERTYPVDLGRQSDERISMSIKLPEGLSLADKPKDLSMVLQDAGGKYLAASSVDNGVLGFTQLFQLSKPVYSPDEYLSLKEFYSRIIQLQKTDLVLKKAR
jgi:transglutaminase-like putative cysteine protease